LNDENGSPISIEMGLHFGTGAGINDEEDGLAGSITAPGE
jgi:hypothetical protein